MKKLSTILFILINLTAKANYWSQKANFPPSIGYGGVGFSIGTKGYIGTGQYASPHTQDLWEWDQATNTWTQKANLTGDGRRNATGFSIGTKGYIGTGRSVVNAMELNDFWEWDQSTNTWTQKASVGPTIRQNAIGFSIGTKGYIGTGANNTGHLNDFWEWDQATNIWTQKPNLPADPRENAVGFSIGQYGYIATGEFSPMYNDLWEFCSLNNCVTGIDENSSGSLEIYPNPAFSKLLIINDKSENITVSGTDGRIVIEKSFSPSTKKNAELDISFLPAGIYFIKAGNEVKKFLKE